MSDHVAVVHHDLLSKGGGEAVAMTVLEALQEDYELTLVTLVKPDFRELNEFYDTSVDPVPVRIAGRVAPWLHEQFGLTYYVLQNTLLGRYARRHAGEFDLLFSTINELGLESDSVQYVHFPFDWTVSLPNREHVFHPTVEDDSPYERLCTRVAGVDREDVSRTRCSRTRSGPPTSSMTPRGPARTSSTRPSTRAGSTGSPGPSASLDSSRSAASSGRSASPN
jgi:hypothetical protein